MKYSDRKNRQRLCLYTHIYPGTILYTSYTLHLGSAYLHIIYIYIVIVIFCVPPWCELRRGTILFHVMDDDQQPTRK